MSTVEDPQLSNGQGLPEDPPTPVSAEQKPQSVSSFTKATRALLGATLLFGSTAINNPQKITSKDSVDNGSIPAVGVGVSEALAQGNRRFFIPLTAKERSYPSPENISFNFGPGVNEQDQRNIREGVGIMQDYLSRILGLPKVASAINVMTGYQSGGEIFAQEGIIYVYVDGPLWTDNLASSGRFIGGTDVATYHRQLLGHEYVHVVQFAMGCTQLRFNVPVWWVEGTAEELSFEALYENGMISRAVVDQHLILRNRLDQTPLENYTTYAAFNAGRFAISVSQLAVERLTDTVGVQSHRIFCQSVFRGGSWQNATTIAYGQNTTALYAGIEQYRASVR